MLFIEIDKYSGPSWLVSSLPANMTSVLFIWRFRFVSTQGFVKMRTTSDRHKSYFSNLSPNLTLFVYREKLKFSPHAFLRLLWSKKNVLPQIDCFHHHPGVFSIAYVYIHGGWVISGVVLILKPTLTPLCRFTIAIQFYTISLFTYIIKNQEFNHEAPGPSCVIEYVVTHDESRASW